MLPVSPDFLEAIKAGTRNFKARIEVTWTDPYLDQSIQVFANEEANISWVKQVADSKESANHKWLSLDGSSTLDGAYYPAPSTKKEADDYQVGWWGSSMSDEDGYFSSPYPTLTVRFFARPVYGLKVVGDDAREEFPQDFDINLYEEEILVHTESIVGNTGVSWQKDISDLQLSSITEMKLIVKRWSHSSKQVKILEFFSSVQEIYDDDQIMQINLLEERELSDGSLPIGNISSNEIDIKLSNIDYRFSAGNINSPLHQKIKVNRKIRAWLGLELPNGIIEYLPLGTFWSGDWSVSEQQIYASTSARDRLELLRKTTFSTSQVYQNITLYKLALIVFDDADIEADEYWIDTELQEFVIPWGYFQPVSHREALRQIAEACGGQVYCDRKNVIRVEGPSFINIKGE
ncbi:hypothetical protein U472_09915 [Orenia metallireducens]|jgi:hypothetical protein|uniref:Uncharacterized protein n=1 Tax=Orenia metallireducens TaxID=1413210 RepID=A0A1C0A7S7_9FIRM|nr:hypothetical protein [Orenia metallireducens]OCL26315.1 hypothetical protein U472_09915 [Orenia metallireducens]